MAGITFPNIAGTLAPLMQLDLAAERNSLEREQARRANEAEGRAKEAAPHISAALAGDREALNRVATASPETAMKLAPLLERLDASKATRLKEDADFITRSGMAILNAPPEQQPQLYARARQEAEASGRNVSQWPTTYDPGWVKFNVDKAMPVAEYYKKSGEGVTFAPPAGGGGAPAGGGVSSNNIGNVRPVGGGPSAGFQQPPTLEDGIRLAVNNVKAYPAKFNNGQPMTLLQIGERWAPRGDGANDPVQWARNVASIGGLDPTKPLNFNDPQTAAAFARGVHGAEHGANKVLPLQQYAQAITGGATPPGLAQGSDMPADGSGNPLPPAQQALAPLRGLQLPPGARVALKGGLPVIQDGNVLYLDSNGGWGAAPLPPRAAPKEQGAGPFAGNSVEAQALNMLIANGTLTQPQAAELAAGKTITNPADGSVLFMTPSGLFGQRPGQAPQPVGGGAPGGQAPQAGAPPGAPGPATQPGMIQVTPAKPQVMTEGQANAALYADRIRAAEKVIAENETAGLSLVDKGLSAVPVLGNKMVSEGYQLYEQARRDFINAVLRRESGAVISDAEFANAEKQYFPQPGDKPEVLKQKANNRRIALEGISRAAGSSYKPETAAPAAAAVPATAAPKPPQGGAERGRVLFEARDAIAKGADPAKVKERLKSLGIEDEP
jgi:hypothetical protein